MEEKEEEEEEWQKEEEDGLSSILAKLKVNFPGDTACGKTKRRRRTTTRRSRCLPNRT